jgi:hypothetical protein
MTLSLCHIFNTEVSKTQRHREMYGVIVITQCLSASCVSVFKNLNGRVVEMQQMFSTAIKLKIGISVIKILSGIHKY